jgi:methyltransferase (TIGR00027 family)
VTETPLMDPTRHSLTAVAASLFRAVHTRADQPALLQDPYGERLLTEDERGRIFERLLVALRPAERESVRAIADPGRAFDAAVRMNPSYAAIIVRTRYAEDRLAAALERGVRQYVIVGAGMDSFGLRQRRLEPPLEIYEIDHPATQTMKRERFARAGLVLPASVHFVAADLEHGSIGESLARSAYRQRELTFFVCLGVTPYLTREANLALLADVARCAEPSSELVFDYLDQDAFAPDRGSEETQRLLVERSQTEEPWVSGFRPASLARELAGAGLALDEDLDSARVQALYLAGRTDGLRMTTLDWHAVRAHVEARHAVAGASA